MDIKPLVYFSIIALVMIGVAIFSSLYFNPEDNRYRTAMFKLQPAVVATSFDYGPRRAPEINWIGVIGVVLLVRYLVWPLFRMTQIKSQPKPVEIVDSLHGLSVATGITEYDLFCKSAETWSVSENRIDNDFKRYMAHQILPYYVKDLVRKNRTQIDESLIKKEKIEPTTWTDWAVALLVFPGSFLLMFILLILYRT